MLVANFATLIFAKAHLVAFWLLQATDESGGISWDPWSMLKSMGWIARIVVVILFIMSAWSIGVMIDRFIAFSAARKQSRQFAPAVAGALVKANWMKPFALPSATRRAIWPRLSPPACRNSKPTANPLKSLASRLKPASAPWNGQKPLCMLN